MHFSLRVGKAKLEILFVPLEFSFFAFLVFKAGIISCFNVLVLTFDCRCRHYFRSDGEIIS